MIDITTDGTLYQWDTGRKIKITRFDRPINEIHFSNDDSKLALVVQPLLEDGYVVAKIPNVLLQTPKQIYAHIVSFISEGEQTVTRRVFMVNKRAKPEDYVYTETEVLNYSTLINRIERLESGILDGEDGREIELQNDGTYINWRYAGDDVWNTLVAVSDLKGRDGKSAYELAVANGYTGTQEQWLESLVGDRGAKWYYGTIVHPTHKQTNSTEITGVKIGDFYINTKYGYLYICSNVEILIDRFTWEKVMTIKGSMGANGIDGTNGTNGIGTSIFRTNSALTPETTQESILNVAYGYGDDLVETTYNLATYIVQNGGTALLLDANNNMFLIDIANSDLENNLATIKYLTNINGKDGTRGNTIYHGVALTPGLEDGEFEMLNPPTDLQVGDYYLNTTHSELYQYNGTVWIYLCSLKGDDGYTPIKGVDYFTSADKEELVQLVLAAIPNGDEVAY